VDRSQQVTQAPDGRRLVFAEWGDLDGSPVFALHGTPGCRLLRHPDEGLIASTGARLITYDRPGYGGSDRHHGHRMADAAGDVTAIADHLALGRFAVFGVSGGVAALGGDRVTRAASVVGLAPFDVLGDDWYTGMDPQNVTEVGWALDGEDRLAAEYLREDEQDRARVAEDPAKMLENFDLSEADRAVLARPDLASVRRAVALEQTRHGVWGWVDDSLAQIWPWGFDPATISVLTPNLVRDAGRPQPAGAQRVARPHRAGRHRPAYRPGAFRGPGRRHGRSADLADRGGRMSTPGLARQALPPVGGPRDIRGQ
jgi:pimeloyl-ACP methyl ester carboxylesterase